MNLVSNLFEGYIWRNKIFELSEVSNYEIFNTVVHIRHLLMHFFSYVSRLSLITSCTPMLTAQKSALIKSLIALYMAKSYINSKMHQYNLNYLFPLIKKFYLIWKYMKFFIHIGNQNEKIIYIIKYPQVYVSQVCLKTQYNGLDK